MNNKSIILIFVVTLFVVVFVEAKEILISRKDVPAECCYFHKWDMEDTFHEDEVVEGRLFRKRVLERYKTDCFRIVKINYFPVERVSVKGNIVLIKRIESVIVDV